MADQLSAAHAAALDARGIDPELAAEYGLHSEGDWLIIPYMVAGERVNRKFRTLGDRKEFKQDRDAVKCLWNFEVIGDETLKDEPLIICEGEMDALIAIQCGFVRAVSVPDGAPAQAIGDNPDSVKYGYLEHAKAALKDVREIILAVDADPPGTNLLSDLSVRLGKARCKWVKYPKGCKDLNDAFSTWGERGVKEAIARAQFMRIDGVYKMSDLPPLPAQQVYSLGDKLLAEHYNMRPGDMTVVTGIPNHGKSAWIDFICCTMAEEHGWVTASASFEQRPQVDHKRNLRTWHGRRLVRDMDARAIEEADAWIDQHFVFIVPSEDDDVTLVWLLERAAAAIIQHGARIIVIDPWNEMDHDRPNDMSLTEYTGFAIKQFRKLATKYQVHVIVAAHPTKQQKDENGNFRIPTLYDIADSAHWYNKPDVGIVVHRRDKVRTLIRVAKSRYHDQIGSPGDLDTIFEPQTRRFKFIDTEAEKSGGRPYADDE
jgi:twinkle protein